MSAVVDRPIEQRARDLRAAGLGYVRIAAELGVSATTVRRLVIPGYAERMRHLSHDAKRRRTGTCANCGRATRYNGRTTNGPSSLCAGCGRAKGGVTKIGKGPVQRATLAFCTEPRRFTEICGHLGITQDHAGGHLHRMVRHGLLTRLSRGVYIATSSLDRSPAAETAEAASPRSGMAS